MRKLILLLLVALGTIQAYGQNLSDNRQYYINSGLTLECKLGRTGNFWLLKNLKDIDFEAWEEMYPANMIREIAEGIWTLNSYPKRSDSILDAFYQTFTTAEINSLADQEIIFHFITDNTGKIVRLTFSLRNNSKINAIPVSKWATLYTKIKELVVFNVVDTRTYYNYSNKFVDMSKVKNREVIFTKSY